MLDAHEPPTPETSVCSVASSWCGKHALDSVGTDQLHRYITPLRVLDPNPDGDMFQGFEVVFLQGICGDGELARDTSWADWFPSAHFEVDVHGTPGNLDGREVYPSLWLDELPLLGLRDVRVPVESSITILVAEGSAGSGFFPVRVVGVYDPTGPDGDMLDITPR